MKLFHKNCDKLKLLIFFAGFSQSHESFIEFANCGCDILFVYDYSELNFSIFDEFDFSPYTEINLIGYSFGVFAANISSKYLPQINNSCAISGTIYPIDENFGIKPKIFDIMLNSFNEEVFTNFIRKMETNCAGKVRNSKRTIQNLHEELLNIKKYAENNSIVPILNFDKAIVTKRDRIISYSSQLNFWHGKCPIIELNCGHFPFYLFNNFDEILEL